MRVSSLAYRRHLFSAGHCGWRVLHSFRRKYPSGAFRVLIFHSVSDHQLSDLERLVQYLQQTCGIISPSDAEQRLGGAAADSCAREAPCLLTFDDGCHSNYVVADNILNACRIKALFFLCPQLISASEHVTKEERDVFRARLGLTTPSYDACPMSWRDVKGLISYGHTIGAHTMTHCRLASLSATARSEEIINSAITLEERLGVRISWFAYPYGDIESINAPSFRVIASRYMFCCSGVRGINSAATHPLAILREHIDLNAPFQFQTSIALGAADWAYHKQRKQLSAFVGAAKLDLTGYRSS